MAKKAPDVGDYKYGFHDDDVSIFRSERGLTENIVREISNMKNEPEWMLDFRLKSLKLFYKMPMPQWGGDLSELNFDDITYYVKLQNKLNVHGMKCQKKLKELSIN